MNRVLAMAVVAVFMGWGVSQAGEQGFETTAEAMVERLMNPGSAAGGNGAGESWKTVMGPDQPLVNRSITIMRKETDREVWETVMVPERRRGRFVHLGIAFDRNSSAIRPESFALINELGRAINDPRLRDRPVFLNGHTDSDGDEAYNLRLSLYRGLAVRTYLALNCSVAPDRLMVYGYGEAMPLRPNTSAANKALNRRVEIVVSD